MKVKEKEIDRLTVIVKRQRYIEKEGKRERRKEGERETSLLILLISVLLLFAF